MSSVIVQFDRADGGSLLIRAEQVEAVTTLLDHPRLHLWIKNSDATVRIGGNVAEAQELLDRAEAMAEVSRDPTLAMKSSAMFAGRGTWSDPLRLAVQAEERQDSCG